MKYKILIVAGPSDERDRLHKWLTSPRVSSVCTEDFTHPRAEFRKHRPDLVLIDVCLPDSSGYQWCLDIRGISRVPILMIAAPDDALSRKSALELGADSMLEKPIARALLYDQVTMLLRKSQPSSVVLYQGIALNTRKNELTFGRQTVRISRTDALLLRLLLERPGQILSSAFLSEALRAMNPEFHVQNLSACIRHLRLSLDQLGLKDLILTQRGKGYLIR